MTAQRSEEPQASEEPDGPKSLCMDARSLERSLEANEQGVARQENLIAFSLFTPSTG